MTDANIPAALLITLSDQLLAVGRQLDAVAFLERARTLAAQRGDTRTPAYAAAGFNHCPPGQEARCEQRLVEAKQILAGFLPPQHATFDTLETTAAELALARGEPLLAEAALLRALAIFDRTPTLQPARTRAAGLLARTELALGRPDAAAAHAEEAVRQARTLAKGFAHSQWLGNALLAQGLVQQARGEAAAARVSWSAAAAELEPTLGPSAPASIEARRLLAGR